MTGLVLRGLTKAYGAVTALDGLDLEVKPGTRTAIVGPSGCGKSTLLRVIAGFEPPDRGRVVLDGEVMADDTRTLPAHQRRIGIVMQDGGLFPHLSVAENVGFGLARHAPRRSETIGDLVDLVALPRSLLDQRPDQLSGGQQQRVALARALARDPRLMLLDEPFSALDTGLRAATRDAVADLLAAKGITTILVTHDQVEALSFADQVAVMCDGRLRGVGAPRELYLRPRDAMVASFLGDAILLPADMVDGRAACALGQLACDAPERRGGAMLMLRPEQVTVSRVADGPPCERACGEVLATSFRGATSALVVRLLASPEVDPLHLTVPGRDQLAPGDVVAIGVSGQAHILSP